MKLDPEDEHLRGSLYILPPPWVPYAYLPQHPPVPVHRHLIGVEGMCVDHMNGDTLDNRKANLRNVTRSENQQNSDFVRGQSRFRGVSFNKHSSKWLARIKYHGHIYHLGYHATEADANRARLAKEKELWGVQPRRKSAFDEIAA